MSDHLAFDVLKIRKEFPFLEGLASPVIYLDSAATSQKPREVVEVMSRFLLKEYATVHRAVYPQAAESTSRYDGVRELVQKFIGAADSSEIIFTRGTTEGINLVASSFGKAFINEGDEILLSETEHHSNIVPWQMLCSERKATLRVIPVDDNGEIRLEAFERMLSPRVKLVSVAHIANSTGVIHPIAEIIRLTHSHGAKVLIDAAQSISHLSIDVQKLDADFLVFSGHKAYGPTGVGVLYAKKDLLEKMPPYQGGGDMIKSVSFEKTTYQDAPLKFEAGTPSIVEVIGLGSSLEFINRIGLGQIEAWEKKLVEYALLKLVSIPEVKLLSEAKNKSSIISFNCKHCHPLDVGTLLGLRGVSVRTGHLCAQPALKRLGVSSTIRISFAVYNTFEEIDQMILALKETIRTLV